MPAQRIRGLLAEGKNPRPEIPRINDSVLAAIFVADRQAETTSIVFSSPMKVKVI
jgi:hypothetical protein